MNIDKLRVASPCSVSWDQMLGDDRVRFCDQCKLNVYNFAELSSKEAEQLIRSTNGRLCGRLYRRHDGTILTADCPVGLRALRRRVTRRAAAVFATIIGASTALFGQSSGSDQKSSCTQQTKITRVEKKSTSAPNIVAGTLLDPNGAVIPNVKIVVKNMATSRTQSVTTGDDGTFTLSGLPAGRYSLNVKFPGFKTYNFEKLLVQNDSDVNVVVTLLVDGEMLMGIIAEDSMTELPAGSFRMKADILIRFPF